MLESNDLYESENIEEKKVLCPKSNERKWAYLSLMVVLVIIVLERAVFFYYSIYAVLPTRYSTGDGEVRGCNPLQNRNITETVLSKPSANYVIFLLANALSILGGLFGDGILGRVKTTLLGSMFYFVGILSMCFVTNDVGFFCSELWQYISAVFVLLGVGLIRPNVISMGVKAAQKVGMNIENYFILYYLGVGCGQSVGYALQLININLTLYMLSLVCLWLAFLFATKKHMTACENRNLFFILKHAMCFCRRANHQTLKLISIQKAAHKHADKKPQLTMDQEDAQWIMQIIPFFATFIVQACTIYAAIFTFNSTLLFILNDETYLTYKVHVLWLLVMYYSSMSAVSIIMILLIRKFNFWKCAMQRNLLGMFATLLSLIVAIILKTTVLPPKMQNSSWNLTSIVLLFLPQEFLLAAGESLVFTASNEIAFRISPKGLESFTIALFTTVWGIGAIGALIFILIIRTTCFGCLPDVLNSNEENIRLVLGILSIMVFFNSCIFYLVRNVFRKIIQLRNCE